MKNKTLIIDGNNLLHRAYHQYKNMRASDGTKTSMVWGFPYILQSLIKLHKPTDVMVIFDGGRDKRRLKILPEYKQRKHKDDFDYEDFIKQKESVKEILGCLGIPITFDKGLEADDLIWLYARKKARSGFVIIVSTDKDFNQLIDNNISIWNPFKQERITHKNIEKLYGYLPEQCVDYLCLDGDDSDNIKGYPGVGPKKALKFLSEYQSITNYIDNLEEIRQFPKKKLEEVYKRNRQLIDIKLFVKKHKIKLRNVKTTKPKFDAEELAILCSNYSISTFTKKEFLITYKQLYNGKKKN